MKPHPVRNSELSVETLTPPIGNAKSPPGHTGPGGLRRLAFFVGDSLFLVTVSIVAVAAMHMAHELGWHLVLALICGMALAMGVQVLLATLVAPVLGSIESMVPSMVAAMISPMAVCVAELSGFHPNGWTSAAAGAAIGIVTFLSIEAYGFKCRARFKHALLHRGGVR